MGMFTKILGGMGGKGGGMMGGGGQGGGGGGGGGGMGGMGSMSPSDNPYTGFGIGGGHFSKSEPPKPRIEERQQNPAAGAQAGNRIENRQQRAGIKKKLGGTTPLNDEQGFDTDMFMQFLQKILSQGGNGQEMGGFEQNFGRKGSFSSGYRGGQ